MLRQWIKVMLMAILVLIQTACPKFLVQQNTEVSMHPSGDAGGSDSGSG
jgi:hypothetical protein